MMVAVFGTMAADGVRRAAGVTDAATTPLFALATAPIFALWYRSEGTLSIQSITTRRRGMFYWAAMLSTFALGTAAGDLTVFTLHLGFFASILLFAIIAVPAVGWWRGALNPTVAFWAAYVVTRWTRAPGSRRPSSSGVDQSEDEHQDPSVRIEVHGRRGPGQGRPGHRGDPDRGGVDHESAGSPSPAPDLSPLDPHSAPV